MEQRILGKTGRNVSIVGLGTWQLGADWGNVDPAQAQAILAASVEAGVNFFDTADVYGDGKSEQAIGKFLADIPGLDITVGTKIGRRMEQQRLALDMRQPEHADPGQHEAQRMEARRAEPVPIDVCGDRVRRALEQQQLDRSA